MSKARYTVADFAEAIPGSGGIMSTIARRVGCDWNTANKWCGESPTLARMLQDERESILDMAESVLMKSIKEGDTSDAKWLLARKGKQRGYADKQEVDVNANVTIVKGYAIVNPDDWDDDDAS